MICLLKLVMIMWSVKVCDGHVICLLKLVMIM